MQCPLFKFDDEHFTAEEQAKLWKFSHNVHQLTVDVSYSAAVELPHNIHYIPFATNFHYVPKLPGRDVRLATSYPGAGLPRSLQSAGEGADIDRIISPPASLPWMPAKVTAHERPVLACYVGKNSRKPEHLKGEILEGWRLKDAVRLRKLICFCSQESAACASGHVRDWRRGYAAC